MPMAHPLAGCVSSLQSSLALLESSIAILDTGVHDFPRLSKVLSMTRVRSYFISTVTFPCTSYSMELYFLQIFISYLPKSANSDSTYLARSFLPSYTIPFPLSILSFPPSIQFPSLAPTLSSFSNSLPFTSLIFQSAHHRRKIP